MNSRSTWAEIDLAALVHNFKEVRQKVGPDVGVMAIIKAQGYGHGMVQVSRPLEKEGVNNGLQFSIGL
ncbi:unnamed protein product [marine sediment metagenome]|uniref:Alanine racemase N-terminal domain-containing protein n=1 Tax=marine sediment metagenome TaxID=412755 RepID=X1ESP2_9ZZZZ